jgi:hypothetical protein
MANADPRPAGAQALQDPVSDRIDTDKHHVVLQHTLEQ